MVHLYDSGKLEVTGTHAPDATRQVLATGRVCTNAHYQTHAAMPWYDARSSLRECEFLADVGVAVASIDYWFYGDSGLTGVSGWANVSGLHPMRQAFNGCTALALLDLRGLDPSTIKDYFYAFAGCTALASILVDSTWALVSGASGMSTFYNCTSIVGGNGTAYSGSATSYARMVGGGPGWAGRVLDGEVDTSASKKRTSQTPLRVWPAYFTFLLVIPT